MASSTHRDLIVMAFRAWDREAPFPDSLAAYLDELAAWSRHGKLTGLRTARDRVEAGVMDSVPLADALGPGCRLVDVGSGNGLPGLVVAVLRPDVEVVLVEPNARRSAFLRTAASSASARNVRVERSRVEDLEADPFDAAVSRAAFQLPGWLEVGRDLVGTGGLVFALTAVPGVPDAPPGLRHASTCAYRLPWSARDRFLLGFVKV